MTCAATKRPGWEYENELALAAGWEPLKDPHRGYGWCYFSKPPERIWTCRFGWVRAKLTHNETWIQHLYYKELKDALEGKGGVARG